MALEDSWCSIDGVRDKGAAYMAVAVEMYETGCDAYFPKHNWCSVGGFPNRTCATDHSHEGAIVRTVQMPSHSTCEPSVHDRMLVWFISENFKDQWRTPHLRLSSPKTEYASFTA